MYESAHEYRDRRPHRHRHRPHALSIDGQLVSTDTTFDVLNPATDEVLAQAPDGTAEHVEAAVAAAKKVRPAPAAEVADVVVDKG